MPLLSVPFKDAYDQQLPTQLPFEHHVLKSPMKGTRTQLVGRNHHRFYLFPQVFLRTLLEGVLVTYNHHRVLLVAMPFKSNPVCETQRESTDFHRFFPSGSARGEPESGPRPRADRDRDQFRASHGLPRPGRQDV